MVSVPAIPYLDAAELAARLPWTRVADALDAALATAFRTAPVDRIAVPTAGGELLVMPAASAAAAGVKLVGIGRDNDARGLPRVQGVYVLFDAVTMTPQAVLDGTALTTIRTAGQSAAVVRRLAAPGASRLVVFGAGPQARAHVEALRAVRPVGQVRIVARRRDRAEALCAQLGALDVAPGTPEDVMGADLVVTATTSTTPVFDGRALAGGAFVVAVGSHTPAARELDDTTLGRADLVLAEHRATALREAGDLIAAVAAGALAPDRIRDFGDVVAGGVGPPAGIGVYKSVGMAYQDLAVVEAATGERA